MKRDDSRAGGRHGHRKTRFLSRLRRRAEETLADDYDEPGDVYIPPTLVSCDGAYSYSDPLVVGPGHPYQMVNCVICFDLPGDHAVRLIAIFDPRTQASKSWRPQCRGYLIHDYHGLPAGQIIMEHAHALDNPNCACHPKIPNYDHPYVTATGNGGFIA